MKIGMIGGAMKPVTKGHWSLIQKASKENNNVMLFISVSDRNIKEQASVSGKTMKLVWDKYLINQLPPNVKLFFVQNPIKEIYNVLQKANKNNSIDEFSIYSDPLDISERFSESKQLKYFNELTKNKQVNFIPVERIGENDVSATQMRQLLKYGMKDSFISLLPKDVNGQGIWEVLFLAESINTIIEHERN